MYPIFSNICRNLTALGVRNALRSVESSPTEPVLLKKYTAYHRSGHFHVKNNSRKKIVVLTNFRGFVQSVKFFLTVNGYNMDKHLESS